jgi:hypothetical protein
VPEIQSAEELAEPGLIVQFGRPPNRIDLLNRIDGVSFEEAWKDKIELRIVCSGHQIPLFMIDLQNLLRNKRASGRPGQTHLNEQCATRVCRVKVLGAQLRNCAILALYNKIRCIYEMGCKTSIHISVWLDISKVLPIRA